MQGRLVVLRSAGMGTGCFWGAWGLHHLLGYLQNAFAAHILCVCAESLSRVHLFITPGTVSRQAPLSMGFSRQEYCSGLPLPPPGDPLQPGIDRVTCGAGRFFTVWDTREPLFPFYFLPIHKGKKVNKQNLVHFKFVSPISLFKLFISMTYICWQELEGNRKE